MKRVHFFARYGVPAADWRHVCSIPLLPICESITICRRYVLSLGKSVCAALRPGACTRLPRPITHHVTDPWWCPIFKELFHKGRVVQLVSRALPVV